MIFCCLWISFCGKNRFKPSHCAESNFVSVFPLTLSCHTLASCSSMSAVSNTWSLSISSRLARLSMCVSSSHSSRFFKDRLATSVETSFFFCCRPSTFCSSVLLVSCRYSICLPQSSRWQSTDGSRGTWDDAVYVCFPKTKTSQTVWAFMHQSECTCLKVKMGDQFLVAHVLSLKGNHIMRSTTLKCMIQTLNLFVSQLHLREVFKE